MNIKYKSILFPVIFLIIIVCCWQTIYYCKYFRRITTKESLVRMFIQRGFPAVVLDLACNTNEIPPGDMKECLLWISKHETYLDWLNDSSERGCCVVDMDALEIRDVWGNKFDFYIHGNREYTLLSNGPNGIFENGGGDDIVGSFSFPLQEPK